MVDPNHPRRQRLLPKIEIRCTCCCSTRRSLVMTAIMRYVSMTLVVLRLMELIIHFL